MTDLIVNIRTTKKSLFNGKAATVTSTNSTGEFDILAQHANLISLVKEYVILNKDSLQEKKFTISTGILKVEQDRVDIFLDI